MVSIQWFPWRKSGNNHGWGRWWGRWSLVREMTSQLIWTLPFLVFISSEHPPPSYCICPPFLTTPRLPKWFQIWAKKHMEMEAEVLTCEFESCEVYVEREIDLYEIHRWSKIAHIVCQHTMCYLIFLWVEFGLSLFKSAQCLIHKCLWNE